MFIKLQERFKNSDKIVKLILVYHRYILTIYKQFQEDISWQNKYPHFIRQIVKSITFMVRVHQEKVLRKGRRGQVEESFAKLVKISELVSVLIRL